MPEEFVCLEDIHAVDVGLPLDLGLLHPKGSIVVDPLPDARAMLLKSKKIAPAGDKRLAENKRKAGPSENK